MTLAGLEPWVRVAMAAPDGLRLNPWALAILGGHRKTRSTRLTVPQVRALRAMAAAPHGCPIVYFASDHTREVAGTTTTALVDWGYARVAMVGRRRVAKLTKAGRRVAEALP